MNFSINISSLNPNTLTEIDREYEFYLNDCVIKLVGYQESKKEHKQRKFRIIKIWNCYSKRESTVTKEEIIENLKDRYMYTELQELAKRKIKELLVVEL